MADESRVPSTEIIAIRFAPVELCCVPRPVGLRPPYGEPDESLLLRLRRCGARAKPPTQELP